MKVLRTILVDDERVGRSRLRRMLEKEPDIEIVAECADGPSAVEAVSGHIPDLLFLDINMPGLDGFDVLDALGPERQPPIIVFVTAYDEHAVRAFEACALDYLLKPTSPERLAKTLARARERILITQRATASGDQPAPEQNTNVTTESDTAPSSPAPQSNRIIVRSGGRLSFVALEEIDWAEAAGNYVILHVGAQNHMIRETMSGMEAQLSVGAFLRVSRSGIVNLRRVKELYVSATGETAAILADGQRVHITRPLREVAERLAAL